MKRNFILAALLLVVVIAGTSCKKDHNDPIIPDTPATPPPSGFETGTYANGFRNMIDLVDVYTGKVVGPGWKSGAAYSFTADGNNADFYYTAGGQYMQAATKATGSIAFDEGS